MRKRFILVLLVYLLSLTVVASGCGGGGEQPSGSAGKGALMLATAGTGETCLGLKVSD